MKIEKFTWKNGTESNPVPLTKTMMVKLITAANSGNIEMDVSGHYNAAQNLSIESSIIQSLNHLFDNKFVYHGTVIPDKFSINVSANIIQEGNRALISSTGIDLQFLQFACVFYDEDIVIDANSPAQISKDIIKSRFSLNNEELVTVNGVQHATLSVAQAQENAEWTANFYILACPKYDTDGSQIDVNAMVTKFKNGETGNYRVAGQSTDGTGTPTIFQAVAIAMQTLSIPDSINIPIEGQVILTKTLIPANTTKTDMVSYTYNIGNSAVVRFISSRGVDYLQGISSGTSTVTVTPSLFGSPLGQSNVLNVTVKDYNNITIRINQNYNNANLSDASESNPYMVLNPEDCGISNATDSNHILTWIKENTHRYLGKFVGGTIGMLLKQLDDRDSRYFVYDGEIADAPSSELAILDGTPTNDGTTSDSNGTICDVYTVLPRFYYKTVNEKDEQGNETGVVAISFAKKKIDDSYLEWPGYDPDVDNNATTDECILIGTYKGAILYNSQFVGNVCSYNSDNGVTLGNDTYPVTLHSVSNNTPTNYFSQENFKSAARRRNDNSTVQAGDNHFSIVTYEAHKVMALLYYAYYGGRTLNCQSIIGNGSATYPKTTGQTDENGMSDTSMQTNGSINFWGIENWWGDIWEMVDDMVMSNSSGLLSINNYTNTGSLREIQVDLSSQNTGTKCVTKFMFGDNADLISVIKQSGTQNYNANWCDSFHIAPYSSTIAARSNYGNTNEGGVACLTIDDSRTGTGERRGSRLLYRGKVTITDTF